QDRCNHDDPQRVEEPGRHGEPVRQPHEEHEGREWGDVGYGRMPSYRIAPIISFSHFIASSIHHLPPELLLAAGGFPGRARMSRLICGGSASSASMWPRLTSTELPCSADVRSGAIVNEAHPGEA